MSATAHRQLLAALARHLGAALPGVPVQADRARPVAHDVPRAVTLRLSDAAAERTVTCALDWRTTVFVECAARASASQSAEAAADALLAAVWQAVQSFRAGGLIVIDPDAGLEWDSTALDTGLAAVTLRLVLLHRTHVPTLTHWS